jgi:phage baseplate assembly protein W
MNGQNAERAKAFLGVGWAFPPQLEADGTMASAAYEEDIHQAIHIILGTNPGERVMRPDFGAGLNDFVFEPANTTTITLLRNRIERSLTIWEPRIDVDSVTVQTAPGEPYKLLVDIQYQIRATNSHHNLVYPFYLEEGATA